MMYLASAPGVTRAIATLAAGIAAHGAIVSGLKAKHAAERVRRADEIVVPYRPVLDQFTADRLVKALFAARGDIAACADPAAKPRSLGTRRRQ